MGELVFVCDLCFVYFIEFWNQTCNATALFFLLDLFRKHARTADWWLPKLANKHFNVDDLDTLTQSGTIMHYPDQGLAAQKRKAEAKSKPKAKSKAKVAPAHPKEELPEEWPDDLEDPNLDGEEWPEDGAW